jgi:hypothetical protein
MVQDAEAPVPVETAEPSAAAVSLALRDGLNDAWRRQALLIATPASRRGGSRS